MYPPMMLEAHAAQRHEAALSDAARYRQRRVVRRALGPVRSRAARQLRITASRIDPEVTEPVALPTARREPCERPAA